MSTQATARPWNEAIEVVGSMLARMRSMKTWLRDNYPEAAMVSLAELESDGERAIDTLVKAVNGYEEMRDRIVGLRGVINHLSGFSLLWPEAKEEMLKARALLARLEEKP